MPVYKLVSNTGPRHQPLFKIGVKIKDSDFVHANGSSKKNAEQLAAKKLLEKIEKWFGLSAMLLPLSRRMAIEPPDINSAVVIPGMFACRKVTGDPSAPGAFGNPISKAT